MFVTGPEVVKTVTHEEVTSEYLGGAILCKKVRCIDFVFDEIVTADKEVDRFLANVK